MNVAGEQFACEPSPTTRVKVTGSFPAAFRLDVYQPPPRLGLAGQVGIGVGATRELAWGLSVTLELNASTFIYREQQGATPNTVRLATVFSGGALIGIEKAW